MKRLLSIRPKGPLSGPGEPKARAGGGADKCGALDKKALGVLTQLRYAGNIRPLSLLFIVL
jgi:hypothetical protein